MSTSDTTTIETTVIAAATAAAAQVPSATPLTVGAPFAETDQPVPATGQSAVVAKLVGEVSGDVVLIVSKEVTDALGAFAGGVNVASVLKPALEAAAATLGSVTVTSERVEDPTSAMDGLRDKGVYLAVPLLAGGEHVATFALQVSLPTARVSRSSLDLLRNVSMEVTVEIGRTRMTVADLLSLHPGAVVELDRAAGTPADLLVNGTLVAHGEVVVVGEDYALRVTQIVADVADLRG